MKSVLRLTASVVLLGSPPIFWIGERWRAYWPSWVRLHFALQYNCGLSIPPCSIPLVYARAGSATGAIFVASTLFLHRNFFEYLYTGEYWWWRLSLRMLRRDGRRYFVLLPCFASGCWGYIYLLGYLIFWFGYVAIGGQRSRFLICWQRYLIAQAGLWVCRCYWSESGGMDGLRSGTRQGYYGRLLESVPVKSKEEFASLFFLSMAALSIWYVAILYLANVLEIKIAPSALGIVVVLAELIRLPPVPCKE